MSITKLSPNWACQMGPIHCPKFLLPGEGQLIGTFNKSLTLRESSGYMWLLLLLLPVKLGLLALHSYAYDSVIMAMILDYSKFFIAFVVTKSLCFVTFSVKIFRQIG